MQYKCVNNLDKFSFQDAKMLKCECDTGLMLWQAEGIICRYNNPSNELLTDRYIDTTEVRFRKPVITKFLLEGAKIYDAADRLIEEIPDTIIAPEDYQKIFRLLKDGDFFVVTPKPASQEDRLCCEVAVDVNKEEEDTIDTYWFEVEFDKVVLEWEHFQNKAQVEQ